MPIFGVDNVFDFFAHENMKKLASKVAQPTQIQPKSQFSSRKISHCGILYNTHKELDALWRIG